LRPCGQQGFRVGAANVFAVEQHPALARRKQTKQGFEHSGLARAVGAQQQRDLAAFGLEAQVVQDHELLVARHHVVEFNAYFAHHQAPR
jgi:hypothetical protein